VPSRFAFATPGRPIVLEVSAADAENGKEGEALVAALEEVLPEWRATPSEDAPTIRVSRQQSRFTFRYPGLPDDELTVVGQRLAADALAAALAITLAQQDDRWLLVHAAAIALPRGYLLLYGDSQAGKSSLSTLSAHLGRPLVADDRLVVEVPIEGPPLGIALGAAPRLRQPLPADFGKDFLDFAASHRRRADAGVALLDLARPTQQLAAGARGPILALVSLQRREEGAIEFSPLGRGLALKGLYGAFAAPHLAAEAMTRRLHKLVRRVPAHSLVFAKSRETAAMLLERFGRV
jgi:hypothetical protein